MVSRTSQDTGFSRKLALSASPQPATAVAWSGAKNWEASGEPAVPKWLQGHSGGNRSTLKGSSHSSCSGNEGKTPLIHSTSSTCQAFRLRGTAKSCSQAASSLFSICIGDRQKSNRDSECSQCQDGRRAE